MDWLLAACDQIVDELAGPYVVWNLSDLNGNLLRVIGAHLYLANGTPESNQIVPKSTNGRIMIWQFSSHVMRTLLELPETAIIHPLSYQTYFAGMTVGMNFFHLPRASVTRIPDDVCDFTIKSITEH